MARDADTLVASHCELGEYARHCPAADELLFAENDTDDERVLGALSSKP